MPIYQTSFTRIVHEGLVIDGIEAESREEAEQKAIEEAQDALDSDWHPYHDEIKVDFTEEAP